MTSNLSSAGLLRWAAIALVVDLVIAAPPTRAQISFTDASAAAGITARSASYGASWGDVNGDGHPDLFLNNHARKSSIYLNNGSGVFTNAIDALDPEHYLTGVGVHDDTHGAVWVDFDNDGDQDLVGTTSNRDAIGAKVYATAGGITQLREQNEGYHRWSQNQRRMHFDLADNTTVDLKVNWPSGRTDTYSGVAADHIYIAAEGGGIQPAHY